MRTSLIETRQIEAYITGTLPAEERLAMDAKITLDGSLKNRIEAQEEAYEQVKLYGRKRLRAEIIAVHNKLFSEPRYLSFSRRIRQLFNRA